MFLGAKFQEGVAVAGRPEELLPLRPLPARPHVCFVAPHAWPVLSRDERIAVVGGAEVQQAILARLLASHGYRVSMICLDFGQPPVAQVDGVTVLRSYAMRAGLPGVRFFHPRLSAMWRAMRAADADIYYYRSAAMLVGVLAEFCRRHGRRSIYAGASDRDFEPGVGGQMERARDRWLFRRGLARMDRIVVQNEHQLASCRRTYGRGAVLIPSCYQLPDRDRSAAASSDCVLWVGTLHANKRPEMLLELAERLPHRRFVVVGGAAAGGSAFFEQMRSRAARLPNVEFTGFLPLAQVEPWFDRARVLVNTSTYEGMPNVFLQAWARGVPTVATVDVGVAAHQVAGDVASLQDRVEALFDDALLYKHASQACRDYFEATHSPARVLRSYAALFDEMMQ
jgi:glycosyltransferase involved in cell wall biosynthesis